MLEIRKTDYFILWLDGLRDMRARARIQARIERPWQEAILVTLSQWAKAFRNCGSTTAQATGCISKSKAVRWSSCWRAETNAPRLATSKPRCGWQETYKEHSMRKTKTTRYDVAEHLRTPEEMAAYLEACFEEANGDAAFIAKALGDIAKAKGMSQVARDAGLSRESLYKALSGERSPGFDTILKVINALGISLHAGVARA